MTGFGGVFGVLGNDDCFGRVSGGGRRGIDTPGMELLDPDSGPAGGVCPFAPLAPLEPGAVVPGGVFNRLINGLGIGAGRRGEEGSFVICALFLSRKRGASHIFCLLEQPLGLRVRSL